MMKRRRLGQHKTLPDATGHFGIYGGKYVPETLVSAIEELERWYLRLRNEKRFQNECRHYLKDYVGRPTPLYFARRLTESLRGAKIYLKR